MPYKYQHLSKLEQGPKRSPAPLQAGKDPKRSPAHLSRSASISPSWDEPQKEPSPILLQAKGASNGGAASRGATTCTPPLPGRAKGHPPATAGCVAAPLPAPARPCPASDPAGPSPPRGAVSPPASAASPAPPAPPGGREGHRNGDAGECFTYTPPTLHSLLQQIKYIFFIYKIEQITHI